MTKKKSKGRKTDVQKRIDQRLEELGLADLFVTQLARRWGESAQAVHAFFNLPEDCHLATARKFAKHLDCSLDFLYGEEQERAA